jgi:hypothetical protein
MVCKWVSNGEVSEGIVGGEGQDGVEVDATDAGLFGTGPGRRQGKWTGFV